MSRMTLPDFREDGWLPEGHHNASWEEVEEKFGGSLGSRRERVLSGLLDWKNKLLAKGISGFVVLDGSFVSAKANPGDFDVLIVMDDQVRGLLENDVEAQRLVEYSWCKKVGFDMLPFFASTISQNPGFLEVWDEDSRTGVKKGVLEVAL